TWDETKEPYYPVNDEKNNELYRRYRAMADRESRVIFGGRLGNYQYYDMDKVVARALELFESLS
uniref:UDP-galactopyranose mutase n=1 Tax=uncultured Helicobacter sp. TaxID=175537 RepID=UPI002629BDD6